MTPLLFFLAGMPAAFLLERAIASLAVPAVAEASGREHGGAAAAGRPAWVANGRDAWIRVGTSALAPPLMAVAGARFEPLEAAVVSVVVLAMLLCAATDLIAFRVPDVVTYPGTAFALAAAALLPGGSLAGAAVMAAVCGGAFFGLAVATGGDIGLGDAKLAMLIGAALGFPAAVHALLIGVVVAAVVMLGLLAAGVVGRRDALPYAPFLALGAVVVLLAGGGSFAGL